MSCVGLRTARREDDRVVVGPGAAAARRGVAQRDRRAAGDRDLLQLAAGEERDPLAVRREERAGGALGAGERRRLQLVELADEEPRARPPAARQTRASSRRATGSPTRRAIVGSDASAPMLASSLRGVGHRRRTPRRPQHEQHQRQRDAASAGDRPRQRASPERRAGSAAAADRRCGDATTGSSARILERQPRVADVAQTRASRILLEAAPQQLAAAAPARRPAARSSRAPSCSTPRACRRRPRRRTRAAPVSIS